MQVWNGKRREQTLWLIALHELPCYSYEGTEEI